MKTLRIYQNTRKLNFFLTWMFISFISTQIFANTQLVLQEQEEIEYNQFSGVVLDKDTDEPLVFASLSVVGTNISTVTNTDGEFLIKIPKSLINAELTISILGYKQKTISILKLQSEKNKIRLNVVVTKLSEVVFELPKDAKSLVKSMFKKKRENNSDQHVKMTAFYRETTKKGRKNASLAEAIVTVFKQPYVSLNNDKLKLYKVRKSTDYSRLDTIALKLQGGPYNALFVDLMKYPDYVFPEDTFDFYDFSFAPSTTVNGRGVYVVKFKQKQIHEDPMYYGKLFIDAKTRALSSAIFNLNVENAEKASRLFVKKKPKGVRVIPESVAYRVDYRESDGKWYYGYSNAQLVFKVKRKRKLFSSTYSISSEMAITDWALNPKKEKPSYKESMRHSIIISDEASGFSDPDFWGAYNVIEPEKSIEVAIKKIQKKLIKE